jgi:hypothetical protein
MQHVKYPYQVCFTNLTENSSFVAHGKDGVTKELRFVCPNLYVVSSHNRLQ